MTGQMILSFSNKSIFTLISEKDRLKAESKNGVGFIFENKPWTTAKKDLDALSGEQEMVLLFGDANRIQETQSIEWFALIRKIVITPNPDAPSKATTKIFFSKLTRLANPFSVGKLRLRSKGREGEYFSPYFQRPYALCELPKTIALSSIAKGKSEKLANKAPAGLDRIDTLTEDDFSKALKKIESSMTENQVEMLVGHANSPNHCLSMRKLAELGGYKNYRVGNLQYGRLGGLFAKYFKVENLPNQTQALAIGSSTKDEFGEFQWRLKDPLLQALRSHWSDLVFQSGEAEQAEFDLTGRSGNAPLKPTERAAIIQSRIGQGLYRKNMLELWGGKCALTGCDIPEVLIASHAKPWKLSTNQERMDKYNGLLLAAHVDALFDIGLIGFDDRGFLIRSPKLTKAQFDNLGLSRFSGLRFIRNEHLRYLKEHRSLYKLS
jgi:hypothetical protein